MIRLTCVVLATLNVASLMMVAITMMLGVAEVMVMVVVMMTAVMLMMTVIVSGPRSVEDLFKHFAALQCEAA